MKYSNIASFEIFWPVLLFYKQKTLKIGYQTTFIVDLPTLYSWFVIWFLQLVIANSFNFPIQHKLCELLTTALALFANCVSCYENQLLVLGIRTYATLLSLNIRLGNSTYLEKKILKDCQTLFTFKLHSAELLSFWREFQFDFDTLGLYPKTCQFIQPLKL